MERRAWQLTVGVVLLLVALVGLVVWRGPGLDGAWSLALTATAVLAVVGLSVAAVLAGLTAVRGPQPDEVVVRVPPDGPPTTTVQPATGPPSRLRAALLLALASALPAVLVLVLSSAVGGAAGRAPRAVGTAADPGVSGSAAPTPSDSGASATDPTDPTDSTDPTGSADPGSSPGTGVATGGSDLPPPAPPPAPPETSPPAASPSEAPPAPPEGPPPDAAPPAPPPAPPGAPQSGDQGGGAGSGAASSDACRHEVVQGDSLWEVVEGQLGAGASNAEVAAGTQALYAANADLIGEDPDLILPGQVLTTCT